MLLWDRWDISAGICTGTLRCTCTSTLIPCMLLVCSGDISVCIHTEDRLDMSKSRCFQPYPSTNKTKTRHNRCKQVLGNIRGSGERKTKHASFSLPLDSLGYYWLYISLEYCNKKWVRTGSVRNLIGPVRFGPDRIGPVRFGPDRIASDRSDLNQFSSVRFGSVRPGSVRTGPYYVLHTTYHI
jgi:hypothetical protein